MSDIFTARSAAPMLIAVSGEPFDSPDHVFELKLDGERALAYLDKNETVVINRRGRLVSPQFPEFSELHRGVNKRCILDGELITGEGSKEDFEDIKQRAATTRPATIDRLSREKPAIFVAVDILFLGDRQTTEIILDDRQALLAETVWENERLALSRIVPEKGVSFFEKVRDLGLEGLIAKRRNSIYQMGKRTHDWMKIKNMLEDDFVICGYVRNPGAAVASLILGQPGADGGLVYRGRVTLGLARDEFAAVDALPRTKGRPFANPVPEDKTNTVWLSPRLRCRITFLCWTPDGKLRQPAFVRLLGRRPRPAKGAAAGNDSSVAAGGRRPRGAL